MSNAYTSAFRAGPQTVTVIGGSNSYANPAFSAPMGYGASNTFAFDGYAGAYTVAVSNTGAVSVSTDALGTIPFVGAFVNFPDSAIGQLSSVSSGFDAASLSARVGSSLQPGYYTSTSLGSQLQPPALGSPNPLRFST